MSTDATTDATPTHTWRYWIERAEKEYAHMPSIAMSLRVVVVDGGYDLDAIAPFPTERGEQLLRSSAAHVQSKRDETEKEMAVAQAVPLSDNEDDEL